MFKHVPTCSQRMQGVQTHFLSDSGISWLYGAMMLILSTYIYIYIYIFLYISVCCYGCLYSTWCLLVASATPIKDGAMGFVRLETSHTLVPWGEARAKSDRTGQDCPSKPKSVVQIMWVKQQ